MAVRSASTIAIELKMNVAALRRADPYVKNILNTASQVALYEYNTEWIKTEIEGALFLCERNGRPYQNIIIMNRLNMNNLIEPITKEFDIQLNTPFLLYKNSESKIFGIWFYDKDECYQIANQLIEITDSIRKETVSQLTESSKSSDILRLLNKAQESASKNLSLTSQSVKEFFEKASNSASNSKTSGQKTNFQFPQVLNSVDEKIWKQNQERDKIISPIIKQMLEMPINSLENIEKQQKQQQNQQNQTIKMNPSSHNNQQENNIHHTEISSSLIFDNSNNIDRPMLMTPTMFLINDSQQTNFNEINTTNHNYDANENDNGNEELNSDSSGKSSSIMKVEPLSLKQFQQAFMDLLQNDREFLKKLHESYYKSFTNLIS